MTQSGKFGIKKIQVSSGSLGLFDITDDKQIKIIVANAGPTNVVAVYGKIQGQNSFQLLDTIVGSTNKLIDVALFDFLELEVVAYDSTGNYIDIAGSGFITSTSSASSGLVTVTNFPNPQNVAVVNSPNVNTGLNPLTDAQLRASPVIITGTVNVVPGSVGVYRNVFNGIESVASGASTTLVNYVVPVGKTAILEKIVVSGENIAKFEVFINSNRIGTARTYFGSELNIIFDYSSEKASYILNASDTVRVTVKHERLSLADFEGTIQIIEIG